MNQTQEMLKAMLVMTINDMKQMHGMSYDDVVTVLAAVGQEPSVVEVAKTEWVEDENGRVIAEDTEGTVEVLNIDGVDTVNITTEETVEKKPARKRAAKKA